MTITAAASVGMPAVTGHWPDLEVMASKRQYVVGPTERRRASICRIPVPMPARPETDRAGRQNAVRAWQIAYR